MALTDHDTVAGVNEARSAAEDASIEFLTGTELSVVHTRREVHVLGYGIDPEDEALNTTLDRLHTERANRAKKIVQKLANQGVEINFDNLANRAGVIGRMHIAQEIVRGGHATTVQGAFDKYIGRRGNAYVRKKALTLQEALDTIHSAGGLAFLAHPGLGQENRLDALLQYPFDGIEVYHSQHTAGQTSAFQQVAQDRDLLISGGSDCHGDIKGRRPEMGTVRTPYDVYERVAEALAARTP